MTPIIPMACPVREHTGDGVPVGRCYFHCRDGICPRHGDVKALLLRYAASGKLTDENNLPKRDPVKP